MAGIRDAIGRLKARTRMHARRGAFDTRARARIAAVRGTPHPKTFGPTNLLQNATLNRRLADRYQMKEFSPIPSMATELQPVVIVDDLSISDREETQLVCSVGLVQPAVAAQVTIFELRNPAGSSIEIRMRRFLLSSFDTVGVGNWQWGLRAAGQFSAQPLASIWNTFSPGRFATATAATGTAVGVPGGVTGLGAIAKNPFTPADVVDLEGLIIPTGFSLLLFNVLINSGGSCTFEWIEESPVR